MVNTVTTDGNLRQIQQHGSPTFPIKVCISHLSDYANWQVPPHWHEEFELLLVLSGQMRCIANGEGVTLSAGDAVFVNSGAIHTTVPLKQQDCTYKAVTIHPDFFGMHGSILSKSYVLPFCDSPFFDICRIPQDQATANPILKSLQTLCDIYDSQENSRSIDIYIHALVLWKYLFSYCKDEIFYDFQSKEAELIHKIVSYIKKNYDQPITLNQLAEVAGISRSRCSHLFKQAMRESPCRFLLRYRIEKSCKLLISTNMCITEIAAEVGFCTSSYYCEIFKRIKGMTPTEFRLQR